MTQLVPANHSTPLTTDIVYISDLHKELNGLGRTNCKFADGNVLVLAGDCFNGVINHPHRTDTKARSYRKGLHHLKTNVFPKYELVLYVMGNHDHYDGVFFQTENLIREQFHDVPNFKLLENQSVYHKNILYIGCTLWTDFNRKNPLDMLVALRGMNDYNWIASIAYENVPWEYWRAHNKSPSITPDFIYEVNQKSLEYLKKEIHINSDLRIVVITHHPPSRSCLKYQTDALNSCFANDLDSFIIFNPHIMAWIHGHTHYNTNHKIGETLILSNQCGYSMEECYRKWRPNKVLHIEKGRAEVTWT